MQLSYRNNRWIVLGVVFSIATLIVVAKWQDGTPNLTEKIVEPSYPVQRVVSYSFTLRNPYNYVIKNPEFSVFSPIQNSIFQRTDHLIASHPYRSELDAQGNTRLYFMIDKIMPYATKTISLRVKVGLSDQSNQISDITPDSYLLDEPMVEKSHEKITKLAKNLQGETPQETVEKTYNWVVKNIKKASYMKQDRGALYALEHRQGDCTEFMYLFAALNRANGIPTRNLAGFVTKENAVLRGEDYHNWTEVYVDGRWYLVDPQKEVFMERSSEYVATQVLTETSFSSADGSQRFFTAANNIDIVMN